MSFWTHAPKAGHSVCASLSTGTEGVSCRVEFDSERVDYASHSEC